MTECPEHVGREGGSDRAGSHHSRRTPNTFFLFYIRQKMKRADVGGCRRPVAAPPVAPRGRGMPTYATCQARPLGRLGVAQVSGCEHRFARNQRHRFLFDRQHPPCRGRGGDFRSMPAVEKLRGCSTQPRVEMLLFKFRRKIVDGKPQFVSPGPQNPGPRIWDQGG